MKNKTAKSCVATSDVIELVAIGASIASNCEPCFKYHFTQARKLGVSNEDIAKAVATAEMVKNAPDREIKKLARKYLGDVKVEKIVMTPCCFSSKSSGCCK
ncbi:MAG TPA: hypothetical protein DET40_15125 [Lentisphaeria bacterium]|nr:MAG: hypothetical protein A2X45_03770 [Lentisphaerae bacterium GWF2_50_93]HCE44871.1 hypothetical protein [Lentisphaeria bacterium]